METGFEDVPESIFKTGDVVFHKASHNRYQEYQILDVNWDPKVLLEMLYDSDKEKASRAMKVMLEMKKLYIEELRKAFEGK
jgi:hypothetical protein